MTFRLAPADNPRCPYSREPNSQPLPQPAFRVTYRDERSPRGASCAVKPAILSTVKRLTPPANTPRRSVGTASTATSCLTSVMNSLWVNPASFWAMPDRRAGL